MSIYITIPDLAYWLCVAFMAGVAYALWRDDDAGTFDEPAEVHEQRRRPA